MGKLSNKQSRAATGYYKCEHVIQDKDAVAVAAIAGTSAVSAKAEAAASALSKWRQLQLCQAQSDRARIVSAWSAGGKSQRQTEARCKAGYEEG